MALPETVGIPGQAAITTHPPAQPGTGTPGTKDKKS